ncbi:MAG TPA: type IV toxin-antitoxin system AbiEi family antitoxin [Candidatus Nitrosotalea sp.]|nr:type IV toxin-antitoxin system AbiEi family antitoxin [Candidatus Nitrosotalea sp.]
MSDRESNVLSELSYRNKKIFNLDDIKGMVEKPKNFLDQLVRKKWILKIRRGVYVIAPLETGKEGADRYTMHSFVIGSLLTKPYYVGYWSALNYHGLTEQTPASVYIATPKPRNSRDILNTHYVFVTILPRKMFGTEEIEIEKRKIIISSPEKTIIDCLDHPEHCGGIEEVAKAFYFSRNEFDAKKIVRYAKDIGNTAVIKRLGYICEVFQWADYMALLSAVELKSGYSLLDPHRPKGGHIRERWRIIANAPIESKRWMQ